VLVKCLIPEAVPEEKIHKLPNDKQNLLDDFYNILVKYNADSTELKMLIQIIEHFKKS